MATETAQPATPARVNRLPKTTGALSGIVIIGLGIWAALIPFIGPYFHYAFGNYSSWHFTGSRLLLDVLPGVVAVVGGFLLLTSVRRASGILGGWLATAAGMWLVIGPVLSVLWHQAGNPIGAPTGGHIRQAFEWLGYFYLPGVVIATLAAFATGRFVSRPRLVEEAAVATGAGAEEVAQHRERRGLFRRRRPAAVQPRSRASSGRPEESV